MSLKLTMLPISRPSEEEVAANPALYQQFVEVRTHNQALLKKYAPELPEFFREAVDAFGDVHFGPVIFNLPDGEVGFIESQMDVRKKLERV